MWLAPETAGAPAWDRLVGPTELVALGAGGTSGGFAGEVDSPAGCRWQPANMMAAAAIAIREATLCFIIWG